MQELVTREDGTAIASKIGQQLELFGLQFQVLSTAIDTPTSQVNTQRWAYKQLAIGRASPWATS